MATPSPSTKTNRFANCPFPLIPTPIYTQNLATPYPSTFMAATAMTLSHNVFIRGLNTIYLQAPNIPASSHADFINYCLSFIESLNSHHRMEEEGAFPEVEKLCGVAGLMQGNVEQHHAFTPGLNSFHSYILTSLDSPSTFSGTHLNTLIDAFSAPLVQHLTEEISSLLELEKYSNKVDILKIFDKHAGAAARKMSRTGGTAFFLRNLDLGFEGGLWKNWPGIPGPVWWALNQTVVRWNAGWWVFASCDAQGRLRELEFLGGGDGEGAKE